MRMLLTSMLHIWIPVNTLMTEEQATELAKQRNKAKSINRSTLFTPELLSSKSGQWVVAKYKHGKLIQRIGG